MSRHNYDVSYMSRHNYDVSYMSRHFRSRMYEISGRLIFVDRFYLYSFT